MNDLIQQKKALTWLRIVYPLWAIVGMYSLMYIPSQLIDRENAELTASNIAASELLFRSGIAGSLITQLFNILAVWLLYKLFYSSYKDATLLTAILAFIGIPIAMGSNVFSLAALLHLDDPEQVFFFIKLQSRGTIIASIFWGLWLFPIGYMVIQSPLFPALIGWLLVLAGFSYTFNAFAFFLGVEGTIVQIIDYLTVGELIWMLWVLIMGARWHKLSS
jgi:hypothetical protein